MLSVAVGMGIKSACIETLTQPSFLMENLRDSGVYDSFMEELEQAKNHIEAYDVTMKYIREYA